MKGPPLGPGGEDITWPDQVARQGRRTSSTRNVKPQTSNPSTTRQRATGQHTPPTPVRRTRQREWRRAARLIQRAPDKCELTWAPLQPTMSSRSTNPANTPNPSELLPRAPGEGIAPRAPAIHPRQGRGRGPGHGPVLPPNLPLPPVGHTMDRAKRATKHAGPTGSLMTTGILYRVQPAASSPGIRAHNQERCFQGQGVKGYVRHWSRRAPPPRKLSTKAPGHRAPTTAPLGGLQHL